ncbi:hypothetical protein HYC85_024000 [Camellia sinensis]|uniref:Uncharacterized protein n=1 Tax=Camellia sinensis TaxID=4442 RepID=A0A7J7GII6_CAMSI|nr:hypothetical protein HYC85_024000 [Camellia sinensis]
MESAEMISWGDKNFHTGETHLHEPTQIKIFNQQRNSEVNESTASKCDETIVNEIALFRELLSEINCYLEFIHDYCNKIGKLMLARLLTAHDAMMSYDKTPETCKMVRSEEVKELYSDLMTLDLPHSQYYKDEYSLVVLKQLNIQHTNQRYKREQNHDLWIKGIGNKLLLTSSPESLLRHCCHYRDSASSGTNNYICLRLNNLSLSHIGSIEKLLWVQMLDLSHNQLSSIEGLEAMQLLSCLNLSNNKMGSFFCPGAFKTAEVIESVGYLIQRNRCTRYRHKKVLVLFSPLPYSRNGVNVKNYLEVFVIFKDSKFTQLDIIGNVVAEEEFKLFLVKILSVLNWLIGNTGHPIFDRPQDLDVTIGTLVPGGLGCAPCLRTSRLDPVVSAVIAGTHSAPVHTRVWRDFSLDKLYKRELYKRESPLLDLGWFGAEEAAGASVVKKGFKECISTGTYISVCKFEYQARGHHYLRVSSSVLGTVILGNSDQ